MMTDSVMMVDRISALPDDLLLHILSFLPTKLAFTTTLLSKRWTPLFYSLPVLDFNDIHLEDYETYDRFFCFVHNLMISPLSINQPLKTFRLCSDYYDGGFFHSSCKYRKQDSRTFSAWLEAAIQRRVEVIDLNLDSHTLKPTIFISGTLIVLKLHYLNVGNHTSCVNLPSLKTLHMIYVQFNNRNDYINFLSSCPNLEDLIAGCISYKKLDENNAPVDELKKSLTLSKVVRAVIEYDEAYFKVIPVFSNLIHIKIIYCSRSFHCWDGAIQLLRLCPKLQILYVEKVLLSSMFVCFLVFFFFHILC